ncbi:MAG: ABC transporter substrate-binding protein [Treponema sp.]|nr:ABC transporter substrate-binding protein [Treponema sp.]MBR1402785.1 ABC transporter substrate-binding protein [Treponema sp.]
MKKLMKNTVLAVLSGMMALSAIGCSKKENKIVHIGSSAGESGNFLGIAATAIKFGFIDEEFAKLGWKAEYTGFATGVAVNEGIIAGDVDISTLGDVPCAVGISNDIGLTWIGVGLRSYNSTFVVKKGSPITSVKDLNGKKVGFGIGTTTQYLFESVVKEFGLDRDSIEILNMVHSTAITALLTGNVDVILLGENQARSLEVEGQATIILNTREYQQWAPMDTIVARTAFAKAHPEVVVAFEKALIRARDEFVKNPTEELYVNLSARQLEEHPELGESIYNNDNGKFENLIAFVPEDNIRREQGLFDFLESVGRITNHKDVSTALDNSYYEKAAKELGK